VPKIVRKRTELLPDEDFPPPPPRTAAKQAMAQDAMGARPIVRGRGRGAARGAVDPDDDSPRTPDIIARLMTGDPDVDAEIPKLLQEAIGQAQAAEAAEEEPLPEAAALELLEGVQMPDVDEPVRRLKMKEKDLAKRQLRGKSESRPLPLIVKDVDLLNEKVVAQRLQTKVRRGC
jgi:hypothetical protein